MKSIIELGDLKNKKILLRTDFDIPLRQSLGQAVIAEPFRINKQKETLDYLVSHGAKVVMVAHISAVPSFADLIPQLHILLGYEFEFIRSIELLRSSTPKLALLENIRHPLTGGPGEEKNDSEFAKQLAAEFDYYVNNSFAVCHRNHASVSAITKFLPSYAGFVIEEEVAQLSKVIDAPKNGKVIVMGGAKASTKVPVIKKFINESEAILVGGVVANDLLKEKGQDMGSSVVDDNSAELLRDLDLNDKRLYIPTDFAIFDNKILDIGEKTIKNYCDIIAGADMIVWNGPMGMFENPAFALGTNEIAKAISASKAYKIIGGGDTISAINRGGLLNKLESDSGKIFISTGGGAMLEFLAGNELPGLKALGYYE